MLTKWRGDQEVWRGEIWSGFLNVHEKYTQQKKDWAKFLTERVKLIFGKSHKFVGQ